MQKINPSEYDLEKLLAICVSNLDRSAPRKKNTACKNNMSLMKRNLTKTHMKRNRLQNQYLKNRSSNNAVAYNK